MKNKENDAVFLPGKIHGCEHQVYIIYFNPNADNGIGSYEIEIIDAERILKLSEEVNGDAEAFFDVLPDWFHGEWRYCDKGMADYEALEEAYPSADFIFGRDGGLREEHDFLVRWAKSIVNVKKIFANADLLLQT